MRIRQVLMFLQRFWRRENGAPRELSTETKASARTGCFHELVEWQAAKTPSRVAVEFEGVGLTYRELNERANRLAYYLRKRGVGPDSVVGLGTKRNNDMIVALLGIWKAGGAYVPLEHVLPKERLRYTIQDSQCVVVITEESLRDVWDGLTTKLVFMDSDRDQIELQSSENPRCITNSDNLAQLLYTSGSTGRPKGVEVLHRGLINFLEWLRVEPGITANDTVVATTTSAFDTSGVELFMPLGVGARIVMLSHESTLGTRALTEAIRNRGVTVMQGTPTLLRWFLEYGWSGKQDLKIISGGEALSRELAEKLLPVCGELWNIYGPTETTIWSTVTRVKSGTGPVSIGHPICNTQIHLLDTNLNAVADGQEGEICIGGAGLTRGYHNRPDETEKRFITHPEFGRLYRTGDLGRRMADGEFEYLGRLDHQIKICGERIEPGEIEVAIMRFPRVRQALVIAREDVPGEKRLVAYVTMQDGATLQTQELRRFLMSELPKSLVPPTIVALQQFPLLINGKVDRNALPKPALAAGKSAL